ncbi:MULTISPECIES: hydroxymethylglutaryl-CoA lyase [unclassified Thioclava]|uniref:hydroxymethylglutaryl-CoA lyase n=1 Tax=unclassified Thioclava TaxID=2621713 RepID=UPI0009960F64|nr:hydroxymethylglutaryl-CoA lyase [Thioclava sp. DLFJ4-1]OOY15407.1 hydroxymethylglutaryl-CoA lyase [Thioclava sp. DLFJ4-1]
MATIFLREGEILGNNVEIVDVSLRDGIQNEKKILSMDTKLELLQGIIDAGARRVEITSFVHPTKVPQMADAEDICARLPREGMRYIGLVLNHRGFLRAQAAGVDEINYAIVLSDTFSQRNQGMTTEDGIAQWRDIAAGAKGKQKTNVTFAAGFGCPFEGEVPVSRLIWVLDQVMETPPDELTLADTIGVAAPRDVTERVAAVRERYPDLPIRLHLHNTRNTGLANAWAGYEAGVRSFDAALGGVGGCPFAPRATGNVPSEDLVYMFERSGIKTGYDLDKAIETAKALESAVGHEVPGMLMKAGGFPKPQTA